MWIAGYLGAVGRQHHLLRLGFGDGVGHVVADVIGGVLVASEGGGGRVKKRSEQRDFINRVFELGREKTHTVQKRGGGGEGGQVRRSRQACLYLTSLNS